MSAKLTLNIQDKELIEAAKQYARSQNKSLSALLENILRSLVSEKPNPNEETSISKTLLGSFINQNYENQTDDDLKFEYLKEKYDL